MPDDPHLRTIVASVALAFFNPFSLIRTMTVGSGVAPDLLDPQILKRAEALAGFLKFQVTAGGGISPRPEKVTLLRYFNSEAVFLACEGEFEQVL